MLVELVAELVQILGMVQQLRAQALVLEAVRLRKLVLLQQQEQRLVLQMVKVVA